MSTKRLSNCARILRQCKGLTNITPNWSNIVNIASPYECVDKLDKVDQKSGDDEDLQCDIAPSHVRGEDEEHQKSSESRCKWTFWVVHISSGSQERGPQRVTTSVRLILEQIVKSIVGKNRQTTVQWRKAFTSTSSPHSLYCQAGPPSRLRSRSCWLSTDDRHLKRVVQECCHRTVAYRPPANY